MATSGPGLAVEPSPTPELTLTVFDRTAYPEFAPMLRELPSLHGDGDRAAVVTNVSAQRITALAACWRYRDYKGVEGTKHVVRDSYFPLDRATPLEPGRRLLVTLNGFSRAFDVSRPYASVSAGSNFIHGATNFRVTLDSAVFEDGRIVGTDTQRIADYVHGRLDAMRWIAEQVMIAEASGENVRVVLAPLMQVDARTERQRWQRRFASLASRHPTTAKSWLYLPKPPRFFRSH